jgi:hypothetical protein
VGSQTVIVGLTAIVMVVGLAGTVLPILPGVWLIWAASIVYGLVDGFGFGGWVAMALITIGALAGTGAGIYLPQRRATAVGVPWWGQLLATVLAVIGLFVVPIVGAPLGFVVGIFLTSLVHTNALSAARSSTAATLRSIVLASVVQFAAGVAMVLVWIGWVVLV